MRRILAQTFAVQSIGVALMLGVTLMVSRLGGPDSQGSFALVKSSVDLQVGLFSLGLPSAIVFLLNSTGRGHAAVYRYTLRYGLLLMLALPLLNFAILLGIDPGATATESAIRAAAIGLASAWLTAFALLRGMLLVHTDGPVFSALSIFQWVVIAAVAVLLLNRGPYVFEFAYGLAGATSLALMILCLRTYGGHGTRTNPITGHAATVDGADDIDWKILRAQSVHVLMQAVIFGLQPFLTNAALAAASDGIEQVGLFSIASLVVTLPNLLVALVAPVLFNRWSKSLQWSGMGQIRRNALLLGIAAQAIAILAMPLVAPVISLVFGQLFVGATGATQILLLGTLPIIAGRILTPALQGLGRTDFVTITCCLRLAVGAAAGAAMLVTASPPLIAMAAAWCIGEYAAFAAMLWRINRGEQTAPAH
jgi:O-antigen/teichoic acid export membrane protein